VRGRTSRRRTAEPAVTSTEECRAESRLISPSARPREATTLSTELPDTKLPEAVALDHSTTGAPEIEVAEELAARAPVDETNPLFSTLGVRHETVEALSAVGITRAFAIQELTLPIALAGADVIGQARTGTGKTLGFGIPILQRVKGPSEGSDGVPQALVVVPTRELCVQVTRDIAAAGKTRGIRTLAVYGGRAYEPQVKALRSGVEIVVGTPGRLMDLAEQKHLVLGKVHILVLDEADEMLDLGFLPDIERILGMIPDFRQTMLFSATMPGPIVTLARQFMRQPVHIRAEEPDEGRTVPETDQHIYRTHALDKVEVLARILQAEGRGLTMVFCRTKRTAQKVADDLLERGFAAAAVHGDLGQGAREQALRAFRAGKVDVLVATDVAARGIDVTGVTHVVNFQCPEDEKTYLHRIGRTGRAGASGVAVTFVDWDELPRWEMINKTLELPFFAPLETYSTSEHLFADLGIPASAGGTLPRAQRTRAGLAAEEVEDLGETGRGRRGRSAPASGSSGRGPSRRGEGEERPKRRREEAPGDAAEPAGEARPPRSRARRRSRAGVPLAGEAGAAEAVEQGDAGAGSEPKARATAEKKPRKVAPGGALAVSFTPPEPGGDAAAAPADAAAGGAPRRRRRRRPTDDQPEA
jgi:superfamily II DNA/RNA helicase